MTPLAKPALKDSNINIDIKTLVKEMKLCEMLPIYESYQIVGEEKKFISE